MDGGAEVLNVWVICDASALAEDLDSHGVLESQRDSADVALSKRACVAENQDQTDFGSTFNFSQSSLNAFMWSARSASFSGLKRRKYGRWLQSKASLASPA